MHFGLTNIASGALLFLLLSFTYGCKPKTAQYENAAYLAHIVEVVNTMEDTLGHQTALRYMDSAAAGKKLSPEARFKIYALKEYIYADKLTNLPVAMLYADSMLNLLDHSTMPDMGDKKFQAHKMMADVSYGLEEYNKAYEHYETAKNIADTVQSAYIKSRYLFSLGMANYREGRYLESARLFSQSSKWIDGAQMTDKYYQEFYHQEVLANAGLAYSKSTVTDSGMYFYKAAIAFIQTKRVAYPDKQKRWDEAISIVYGNLASLYKQLGKRDSAEAYFLKSIAINRQSGRNVKDREYNLIKLADLYIDAKDYTRAHVLLDEVAISSKEDSCRSCAADSLELVFRQTEVLARYYAAIGDHEKAFTYLQKHHTAQEKKWNQTQKRIINNLGTGISNAGRDRQIVMLEKDNKIRNQRIAILILITVVSVSGGAIIYYNMRLHKLSSIEQQQRNEKIITENYKKQEELQRKIDADKVNYLALLENTDESLWSLDKDLNILAFNKVYKEFIFTVSGAYPHVGDSDVLQKINPEFYANMLDGYQTALSGATFNSIDKGIKTGSNNLDFAMRFNPIKDKDGEIVGVTCSRKDITEYFSLTNSLKKNTEQFKNIAWIQSHALRGPLTSIMGVANLLSDEDEDIDAATNKELIKGLKEKLDEMDKIIKEIVKLTY